MGHCCVGPVENELCGARRGMVAIHFDWAPLNSHRRPPHVAYCLPPPTPLTPANPCLCRSKLSNCTWYDRDSCCTDSEVTAIMDSQEAIPGASEACIDAFNMLMCWPCDPAQSGYYVDGALTLCLDFCERVYDGCDSFNEAYETAQAFCEAKGYRVQEETGAGCFNAAAALAPAWALLVAASAAVVSLRAPLGRR